VGDDAGLTDVVTTGPLVLIFLKENFIFNVVDYNFADLIEVNLFLTKDEHVSDYYVELRDLDVVVELGALIG
jgi:hypothetical protein